MHTAVACIRHLPAGFASWIIGWDRVYGDTAQRKVVEIQVFKIGFVCMAVGWHLVMVVLGRVGEDKNWSLRRLSTTRVYSGTWLLVMVCFM